MVKPISSLQIDDITHDVPSNYSATRTSLDLVIRIRRRSAALYIIRKAAGYQTTQRESKKSLEGSSKLDSINALTSTPSNILQTTREQIMRMILTQLMRLLRPL